MPELVAGTDKPIPLAIVCPACDEGVRITYPKR